MKNQLECLSNPEKFHSPIVIDGYPVDVLMAMLEAMVTIRKTEQKLALGRKNGLIGGPVHLSAGQEAIAVGVSQYLQNTDRVFGAHRSHSHLLALNPNFYRLFAEVLGKETGFSRGMGGSMHLFDQVSGFYGSVPIVAGTVSLAVGAAMAAQLQKTDDIGVAYIGDGAVEEGVVHESFNLAKIQNAPMLFVIENNLFASHMHISLRQPSNMISRFAVANDIPYELVDGNDVVAVAQATKRLVGDIRSGKGPRLLELITYRWYGHVDWRDDVDVGVDRSLDDIENWKARDPIARLSKSMIKSEVWCQSQEDALNARLDDEITKAWGRAMNDDYPPADATLRYVYAGNK
ncbi:Acetoin dehydrogenase E1 component alpha-subunit (EC 2.3.1.190) [uncultured Gammaproteobacteria bacterium]|jgi:pyruvate dehydrogenase E1 component alpha subunit|nr:Acetoin dehydrogenase E1 component alpha-subunit (EC 2.3.1.190) [uncultured Gammaproteobacteria bacterium]CAC9624983.1 Acetoin dehydrogenase E1 component alpha-subunit (EC 2.3.1.190) [uncultured Gammaproteobacteria bacterium]CAC9625704.1 Acetoin dehydrogenase E1 component alpha-subunit (EC 2.3.1.190) [uncultured Gammaproteobacteria bacterium]